MWWAWIAAGVALGIAEMLIPGFILLGFGMGAVLTGLLLLGGVLAHAGMPATFLVFAVLSLLAWLGLRRGFGSQGSAKIWNRDINDN